MAFQLQSPAFRDREPIPREYSCEGADRSPPLEWSGAPAGTRTFALVVDDPDAPDPAAPKRVWVHWVLYDLPATASAIPEGARPPAGTREGRNDFHRTGWGGPCPPIGRHRYFFRLFALDAPIGELDHPTKDRLFEAMRGHVLGEAELMGTYEQRQSRSGVQ